MGIICELTDKTVLGFDGYSQAIPRITARAIVRNESGRFAVMYMNRFGLYTFPGGGLEEGETAEEAIRREVLEETGCTCGRIEKLGCVLENRAHADYTQENHYFAIWTRGMPVEMSLTQTERENGTCLQWHSLERMHKLIVESVYDTPQRKFMQARDVAALNVYLAVYGE